MFLRKWSLGPLLLDWDQIPVKAIFLTIISKYIQKIRSLCSSIKAQWAIKKRHTYENIGAKDYFLHCSVWSGHSRRRGEFSFCSIANIWSIYKVTLGFFSGWIRQTWQVLTSHQILILGQNIKIWHGWLWPAMILFHRINRVEV